MVDEKYVFVMICITEAINVGCCSKQQIIRYCQKHYGLLEDRVFKYLDEENTYFEWLRMKRGCTDSLKPRAFATFDTVENVGLPSGERAL